MAKKYPHLAANLMKIIEICQLKKTELAAIIGVRQASISEYIHDKADPAMGTVNNICSKFGIEFMQLTNGVVERVMLNGRYYGLAGDSVASVKSPEIVGNECPENAAIASRLKEIRQRLDYNQRDFYENIGVLQQTGSNYESGDNIIPAWVAVKTIARYGTKADLIWWIAMATETAATQSAPLASKLSTDKAQRLQVIVNRLVRVFSLGRPDLENHFGKLSEIIDGFASWPESAPAVPSPTKSGGTSTRRQKIK